MPPMSATWPLLAVQATSSPSWKIGQEDADVGVLVAAGEDVVVQDHVAVVQVVAEVLDDVRCSGGWAPFAMIDAYSVWASVRPARSKTTVTRSPISLKIGDRDERISTVAISLRDRVHAPLQDGGEDRVGSSAMRT